MAGDPTRRDSVVDHPGRRPHQIAHVGPEGRVLEVSLRAPEAGEVESEDVVAAFHQPVGHSHVDLEIGRAGEAVCEEDRPAWGVGAVEGSGESVSLLSAELNAVSYTHLTLPTIYSV